MQDLIERATAKAHEVYHQLNEIYGTSYPFPRLEFPVMRGATVGDAERDGTQIRISTYWLFKETKDMLEGTVPHELCHWFVDHHYKNAKGHGREWKAVMRSLGLDPKRCHSYDMSQIHPYQYDCPKCGHTYWFSKRRHNSATKRGVQYWCNQKINGKLCRSDLCHKTDNE